MFETDSIEEIFMPAMALDENLRQWESVNLTLQSQWFYVVYRTIPKNPEKLLNFKFLSTTEQVASLSLIYSYQIVDVYLGSPGYINGSDSWKMEKLKEIWKASLKNNNDPRGRIYVLDDGREYVHSYTTMESSDFTKKELIFEIKSTVDL